MPIIAHLCTWTPPLCSLTYNISLVSNILHGFFPMISQKVDRLTVPVLEGKKKVPFKDIQIDHRQKWTRNHWRSICTAYGKSPYFEHFSAYFYEALSPPYTYLYQLNSALLNLCLDLLQLKIHIQTTQHAISIPAGCYQDVRHTIRPQLQPTPRTTYQPFPYQQVFGTTFTANLSILDLLFCEGPNAYHMIKKSYVLPEATTIKS
eukprot:gene2957-3690_t